jgi:hypothetical protein
VVAELSQDVGQAIWQAMLVLAERFEQPPAALRNGVWGKNYRGGDVIFVRKLDFDAVVAQISSGKQETVLVVESRQCATLASLEFACVFAYFRGQFYHNSILLKPPSLFREVSNTPPGYGQMGDISLSGPDRRS